MISRAHAGPQPRRLVRDCGLGRSVRNRATPGDPRRPLGRPPSLTQPRSLANAAPTSGWRGESIRPPCPGGRGATGYSLINAASLDDAAALAKGCPIIAGGRAVDVCEALEM